jgi:hypothetical protein
MSFVLLFIGISLGTGGILIHCGRYIYALIVCDGARQLIVALGVKIDELRHCPLPKAAVAFLLGRTQRRECCGSRWMT